MLFYGGFAADFIQGRGIIVHGSCNYQTRPLIGQIELKNHARYEMPANSFSVIFIGASIVE